MLNPFSICPPLDAIEIIVDSAIADGKAAKSRGKYLVNRATFDAMNAASPDELKSLVEGLEIINLDQPEPPDLMLKRHIEATVWGLDPKGPIARVP